MSKRITVKDLARLAGVDHSTVSRALNDSPRVSEPTKERIRTLAREHNFQFNSTARSLSSRRTGVIGIIYPAGMEDFASSLYTNRLFMDLRLELEKYGLDGILLEAVHPVSGGSNVERLIRQNKVDGFLIFHGAISREDYELIEKWELPVVQVHLQPAHYSSVKLDFFTTDNLQGGNLAAEHLNACGCNRFFDLSIPYCRDVENITTADGEMNEAEARTKGFTSGLARLGITEDRIVKHELEGTFQAARDFILKNAGRLQPGDGLFFHSDLLALGALTACREAGVRVPEDVKIIGFDDSPVAVIMDAGITTVHQPREKIATGASKRIHELLEKKYSRAKEGNTAVPAEPAVREMIDPVLIKRETT